MATSKQRAKATESDAAAETEPEEDDLFAEDGDSADGGDDEGDLLDEVEEDDSEGWVPEGPGEGVQGVVLKVGETKSDFEDDPEKARVPTVTIKTKDGDKFRIIGYGAVLRRELYDAAPEVGDTLAVKFFGEKPIKKGKFAGKPYKHFGVAVRRKS